MIDFSPGLILILGALPVPFLRARFRDGYLLALPIIGLALVLTLEPGAYGRVAFLGFELTTLRVDSLANVFGIIFFLAAAINMLYALRVSDTLQQVAALIYSGGASGEGWAKVAIPSTIQKGYYYNNDSSRYNFRGEGFKDGEKYVAHIETKNISPEDGSDVDVKVSKSTGTVSDGVLKTTVGNMGKFTKIEFVRADK